MQQPSRHDPLGMRAEHALCSVLLPPSPAVVRLPGRYTEAAEKYARARDNLSDMTHADAVQLRRACVLNLSSCYLNSSKYEACIQCCQEVLAGEPAQLLFTVYCLKQPGRCVLCAPW